MGKLHLYYVWDWDAMYCYCGVANKSNSLGWLEFYIYYGGVWLDELFGKKEFFWKSLTVWLVKTAKLVFGWQLFGRAVWTQKILFEKAIFISLLGRAFCENNIIT